MTQHNLPELPSLPQGLLDDIANYGLSRSDKDSEPMRIHKWTELINSVKKYATDYALAALSSQGAGEAVYQYQNADGSWIDQDKSSYDYNVKHGAANVRVLYTRPQAAQPARVVDERDAALNLIMKMCNDAKEPCSTDPESAGAIRNGKFASIAGVAAQGLGLIRGPSLSTPPAAPTPSQAGSVTELEVMQHEAMHELNEVLKESMKTGGWVPTPLHQSFIFAMVGCSKALAAFAAKKGAV